MMKKILFLLALVPQLSFGQLRLENTTATQYPGYVRVFTAVRDDGVALVGNPIYPTLPFGLGVRYRQTDACFGFCGVIMAETGTATSNEAARQAWVRAYGSYRTFSVDIPSNTTHVDLCWGELSPTGPQVCKSYGGFVSPIVTPPKPTCSGSAGTIDFGSIQQDKYSGVGRNTSINIYCSGAATIRFTSGNNVSLNNGTRATLKFNGVSQGSSFYMRTGNNSVTVDATLSGTPSLGDFTGSSTVILDIL